MLQRRGTRVSNLAQALMRGDIRYPSGVMRPGRDRSTVLLYAGNHGGIGQNRF